MQLSDKRECKQHQEYITVENQKLFSFEFLLSTVKVNRISARTQGFQLKLLCDEVISTFIILCLRLFDEQ
jgi:hypothetical protein